MNLAFLARRTPHSVQHSSDEGASLDQFLSYLGDEVAQVFALSGALLAFNRDLFMRLGGFEPIFGRGDFEDLDLSLRWKEELVHC